MENKEGPEKKTPKFLYGVLAFLGIAVAFALIVAAFIGLGVRQGVNAANEGVIEPLSDLVARLTLDSTPVILPDPITIVHELNDVARLETAEYIAEKVVRAERDQDLLFGAFGESLLFVAYGEVQAGVDLGLMSPEDIQVVDPVTVMVHLPEAEIFDSFIDEERSYVADRDTGLAVVLTGGVDRDMESEVRRRAVTEVENAALEAGILDRANENAETFMRSFLQGFGFENIIFTDGPPPPVPDYEQPLPKGHTLTTPSPEG